MSMKDIFHWVKVGPSALDYEALTATKTDAPVFDFRDHRPGTLLGFLVTAHAVTTADATNYFEVEAWESDEKTSATALDANAAKVANADILGYTENAVRSRTTNPAYDSTLPSTTQTEKKYLQDGYVPRINATGQAGSVFFFAYRGYKKCVQLRPTETGTSAVTLSAVAVVYNGETVNLVNPATFA